MPPFNVEFFKPQVLDENGPSFVDLLRRLADLPLRDRIRHGNDPAVILAIHRHDQEYTGEAARIRMEDLPSVIDTAEGNRRDLDVQDHEGLGEEIYFLYDADLDVIAVQNRGHFRPAALERLIGELTNTSVDFRLILTQDAAARFDRMDFVTKVNFKLARPRDVGGRPQPAVNGIFQEIDEFDGVAAKLEITIGRRRNRGLRRSAVERLVQAFNGMRENFGSLSIAGAIREENDGEENLHHGVIDFIKERLRFTAEVERRGRGRRLDPEGCRVALRVAIREHRAHLRRYR